MSNQELTEIFDKYNVKKEDFFPNIIKSMEMKTSLYSGLTPRETNSLYTEVSHFYSKLNKTNYKYNSLKTLNNLRLKNEVVYKTEEPEVNQILEGGFKGGYIYKIIGPTETGKTALINSLIRNNFNKKEINILFFSFIPDNIDNDLLNSIEKSQNANLTIVEDITNFNELLLSEYLKNYGEKMKNYDIIIFDPFTVIVYKGLFLDNYLLNEFNKIINNLAWKNNICFIFSMYARKLGNTFWYSENDQGNKERLILRNYENLDILKNTPNNIDIYLYKMKKNNIIKYYMKVISSCLNKLSNFIEWDLNP